MTRAPSSTKEARVPEVSRNKGSNASVSEGAAGAVQSLSNNPSLRALRGESGFDDVQGKGKSAKVGGRSEAGMERQYEAMILAAMKRKREDPQVDPLRMRVAALQLALGKDTMLPTSASQSRSTSQADARPSVSSSQSAASTGGADNSPRPTDGKQGPKDAQPVQPSGPVEPLERVLQVLEGILRAFDQARASQSTP